MVPAIAIVAMVTTVELVALSAYSTQVTIVAAGKSDRPLIKCTILINY